MAFLLSKKDLPEVEQEFVQNPLDSDAKLVLNNLLEIFDKSFRPELLLVDCCWECVSAWYKDDSRRVKYLQVNIFINN